MRQPTSNVVSVLFGLAALAAVGCAPTSQYRYSAVTPTAQPIAWDGRTEKQGFVRFEGTVIGSSLHENLFPQLHDTALMVPQWTVQGAATVAVAKFLELGVRGAYSAYQWTQPSAYGTMPVPDAPPTWGVGPEMRISIPVEKSRHLFFGIVGNAMMTSVPYAQWTLTGPLALPVTPVCSPSQTCVQNYTLSSTQTETHFVWTLGVVPSYAFGPQGEYGHVFAGITATTGFSNDGFTNNTPSSSTGSTVNTFFPLFVASAGYAGAIDLLRLGGQLFIPITGDNPPVAYGLGFMLTVGVAAELWEPKHHGGDPVPDPAPPPEAPPAPAPATAPAPAPEQPL